MSAVKVCDHNMTVGGVDSLWRRAKALKVEVMVCTCCGGPARVEFQAVMLEGSVRGGSVGIGQFCKHCSPS